MDRLVHLCYCGTSGASTVAINIARGSADPQRHAYVLYGVGELRPDYAAALDGLGCQWRHVPKKPGLDPAGYRDAADAIVAMEPAAIFLHGSRTLPVALHLWARGWRRRMIGVQHGPAREITQWRRRIVAAAFSAVTAATVAVSAEIARLMERYALTRPFVRRAVIITNGADAAYWSLPPAEPPSPPEPLRVGMTAALVEYKDQATLLRAVAIAARQGVGVQLCLVGAGPTEGRLRELAGELALGERVEFAGECSADEVRRRMADWHAVAHISHSEATPMAVIEAMLAGRCVVASDIPGLAALATHERTGLLAREGDAESVAAALVRLATDPALPARLGAAARDYAREHFSAERMAGDYERLADSLMIAD